MGTGTLRHGEHASARSRILSWVPQLPSCQSRVAVWPSGTARDHRVRAFPQGPPTSLSPATSTAEDIEDEARAGIEHEADGECPICFYPLE